jgi:hypothetical protein
MGHRRHRLLLSLAIAAVAGCDAAAPPPPVPAGWQTIDVEGKFSFMAPPDLKPQPVQGIDSLVGQYASPTLDVTFDYGWYSDPMDGQGYASRGVSIDGRSARLLSKGDVVAVHVPTVVEGVRLTMSVRMIDADPATAEALLRSIDFP